ncbi:MAG TPA: GNAT family N-acetyltransferase [Devosia sp.]|jgi:CelD/BcsL family acetyltransferase involved in cellulose biosynthesis|nr:GNAT family N-acetyltransferase [Devosia sp.]
MLTINSADAAIEPDVIGEPVSPAAHLDITVEVSDRIELVEAVWRSLTATSIESPGQSYDFIRHWVANRKVSPADQRYVVGRVDGQPVALLPLVRNRVHGLRVLTWFPGANAGCYAPIADYRRLAALGVEGRCALWAAMTRDLKGTDVIYLRSVPSRIDGHLGLLDELGSTLAVEKLYRSEYSSWEECDRLQRSKSRRKHDRQQGDRLAAMGDVVFEETGNGGEAAGAIEEMFVQRSARFKAMGIRDTFVRDRLIGFYQDMAKAGSGVDVRLHVLRLNGKIAAVRYNIVHNDRMFCLISSMSECPVTQGGSPGKQCLLRVMQTVFDQGIRVFDMGSGFTDEKRHWCNVQEPLRHHYIGLTLQGAVIVKAHRMFQKARAAIKSNPQLKAAARTLHQLADRITPAPAAMAADKSE